ncbi:MAG: LacI family DNA-binding transcriptional regulator [Anaerolineales bacterium]|nr:LacI family DNA-binding transcriptional regulator [Anaerolineales bacterium]
MKSHITLKTIARATGFSITTVSRALAGYSDVAESTRTTIKDTAEKLGYYPNLTARQLQRQRSDTIGLILPAHGPRYTDPYFNTIIAGIGDQLAEFGLDLLLSTHPPGGNDEMAAYRRLVEGRSIDGLIVVRTRIQDERIAYLDRSGFPFVCFGRSDMDIEFPYIDEDGEAGFYELTQYLISLGHTRIACISAPEGLLFARYRMAGFCKALEDAGLPCREEWIVYGNLSRKGGENAANQLLDLDETPTAILAANDLMAIGAITVAKEKGLEIGKDLSIAGFDDIPPAELYSLTTLQQPIYEIGKQLTEMLHNQLQNIPIKNPHILLKPRLIIRDSTQPPVNQ